MSHRLDEQICGHAAALDEAAPPIRLDEVRASNRVDNRRRRHRPLIAVAVVVVIVMGGLAALSAMRDPEPEPIAVVPPASSTTPAPELSASEALDSAQARWVNAAMNSYRLTVAESHNFWTQGCTWTTVVSGGVVAESAVEASPAAQECPPIDWTVEQLHDLVGGWVSSVEEFSAPAFGEHVLQVDYDQMGVPVSMEYDLANGDDEEASMRVTFEPLEIATDPDGPGGETAVPEMTVDDPLVIGAEFEVSFTGALRESRGGYFWLQEPDGTQRALLRSDGNPEIQMSYELDVADARMLDDGLSGETSRLVLPSEVELGWYRLCTANSAQDVCIDVEVLDG